VDIVSYQSTVDEETADLLRELLKAEPLQVAESGKESRLNLLRKKQLLQKLVRVKKSLRRSGHQ